VSQLTGARTLSIKHCDNIKNVSDLPNLKSLTISGSGVVHITQLTGLEYLELISCSIKELRGFTRLETCILSGVRANEMTINDMEADNLTIEKCYYLESITGVANVKHVTILDCPALKGVEAFETVKSFKMSLCPFVEDVSMLKNAESIYISQCKRVKDVSSLLKVPSLELQRCNNVQNLDALFMASNIVVRSRCYNNRSAGQLNKMRKKHYKLFKDVLAQIEYRPSGVVGSWDKGGIRFQEGATRFAAINA
jgi:hypothetical protein